MVILKGMIPVYSPTVLNAAIDGLLSNGTLVPVEGAGHGVHRDQREQSLTALKTFLGGL